MYNVVKCDKNGMTGEMYLGTLRNGASFHKTNSVTEVMTSLSQLVNGNSMFNAHSKLVTFGQDLPNLTNGYSMFSNCGRPYFLSVKSKILGNRSIYVPNISL